jgi:fructokinase
MPCCKLCQADYSVKVEQIISKSESHPAPRIVSFGEVLWDLLPSGPVLGGAPFNLACRLNSLGAPTLMASRVGLDELGESALRTATALGLETRLIQRDREHPTGTVDVRLGPGGEPDFTIIPGVAYDFIEFTPELEQAAKDADYICFGSLAQRSPASRETLYRLLDSAPRALKVLDINLRRDCFCAETVRASLARAGLLKLNESEVIEVSALLGWRETLLAEFCAEITAKFSLRCVVVTLGGEGALAHSEREGTVYAPGYRVKVVDTVGSGDAFSAGFLHALFQGESLRACCERGNLMGALNAARPGATAEIKESEILGLGKEEKERLERAEYRKYL